MPPEATESAPVAAPSEEAERAALIAELDAEDSESEAREPAEELPGEAEPSEDTAEDEGEEEGDDEVEEQSFEGADEFREHVKSLLEAGDMRKVEEALGLEKNALKLNGAKFRYVRQQAQKAAETIQRAETEAAKAQNLVESAKQVYGPMVQAKQLFHSGTADGVQRAARFVESHFGVPLTQFVEAVVKAGRGEASAHRGPDPEVAELKQTVQRLLEERTQQQTQAQAQAAEQRHLEAIKGKLGGSPLAKLPDGAKVVYEKIKGSYDQSIGGYRLNLRDAIAAAQDDPAVKWKLHELASKRKAPAAAPGKQPASQLQRKRVVTAPKAANPAEAEAAAKARLIAELEAEERKAERAARRSNARR